MSSWSSKRWIKMKITVLMTMICWLSAAITASAALSIPRVPRMAGFGGPGVEGKRLSCSNDEEAGRDCVKRMDGRSGVYSFVGTDTARTQSTSWSMGTPLSNDEDDDKDNFAHVQVGADTAVEVETDDNSSSTQIDTDTFDIRLNSDDKGSNEDLGNDQGSDGDNKDSEGNLTNNTPPRAFRRSIAIVIFLGGLILLTSFWLIYRSPNKSWSWSTLQSTIHTHLSSLTALKSFFPSFLSLSSSLSNISLPRSITHLLPLSRRTKRPTRRRRRRAASTSFRVSESRLLQWAQEDSVDVDLEEYDLMVNGEEELDSGALGGRGVELLDESIPLSAVMSPGGKSYGSVRGAGASV